MGLRPATTSAPVQWAVERMAGQQGVALVVPSGFGAYARLLHPLADGTRWAAAAPAYLSPGTQRYPYPFPELVALTEGDMGVALVDALVPLLRAATGAPQQCHFGLWRGWGGLHPGSQVFVSWHDTGSQTPGLLSPGSTFERHESTQPPSQDAATACSVFVDACAVQPSWGARDMLFFDGPIENVVAIGTWSPFDARHRRGLQWWWPADRAWFVATEIDYPWTYLAGTPGLIDAIIDHPTIEAVRVEHSDMW